MKRAVVDTNVFISSAFWRGKPRQVLDAFAQRKALLILTEDILGELEQKLHHSKFASVMNDTGLTVAGILKDIRDLADIVEPGEIPEDVVRDKKIELCSLALSAAARTTSSAAIKICSSSKPTVIFLSSLLQPFSNY